MSKRKLDISRRDFIGISIGAAAAVTGIGCGSSNGGGQQQSGAGGQPGGGASTGGTGTTANGGAATGGTSTGAATGGTSTGAGGAATGGTSAGAGGAATGGTSTGAGGAATGGASTGVGGAATGGTSAGAGGAATGGTGTKATGGAATGGTGVRATGGAATGGAATGGTTSSSTSATPLVSMVRGTDWVQATQDAIAAVGGLPDLSGKTVMLRPNVISTSANSTTSKDVIQGVIRAVKAKNPAKIIVGEDGWNTGGDTVGAMTALGITAVCTAENSTAMPVTPMDLSKQTYTTRTNANASSYPNGVSFSDPVYNADYVIAIPICKTHGQSRYTMAFKLWYGNVPGAGRLHPSAATFTAPAELYLIKKADFVVLDATKCMITGGPDSGTMAQSKIVMASKDAIAADVTGLCILKYNGSTVIATQADAWTINQVARALALKFPGWLAAKTQFPYVAQGVTEAATIMGY